MRVTTKFALPLAALLFGLLLVPGAALAQTSANCPIEPATNVPIALGQVYAGTNCNLYTAGDIDSFVFTGKSGYTYELAAALNGASQDICLTLYDPSFNPVPNGQGCTWIWNGQYSVVTYPKLAANGTYTLVLTESSSGKQNYAVSLQQFFPFPPYATQVPKWNDPLPGNIAHLTETDFFTFPVASTGKYRVTGTLPGSPQNDVCGTLYYHDFTAVAATQCTWIWNGAYKFQFDFTPTAAQAGTVMADVQVAGNDGTQTYTFQVSCLVGNCPQPGPKIYPQCTLTDSVSYNATTDILTMKFTVGNSLGTAANWSAWLMYADPQGTSLDTMQKLFSVSQPSQPNTKAPLAITKTFTGLASEGNVGVLSTLSTPAKARYAPPGSPAGGIACSSWVQTNTGPEPTTISSFSPASGPVGTSVQIIGENFTGATSVTFGGVKATSFTVNSYTKITATVPAGAMTGKIVVTAPGGTTTSAGTFTVM